MTTRAQLYASTILKHPSALLPLVTQLGAALAAMAPVFLLRW